MTQFTIPYSPAGTSVRDISKMWSNFSAIANALNAGGLDDENFIASSLEARDMAPTIVNLGPGSGPTVMGSGGLYTLASLSNTFSAGQINADMWLLSVFGLEFSVGYGGVGTPAPVLQIRYDIKYNGVYKNSSAPGQFTWNHASYDSAQSNVNKTLHLPLIDIYPLTNGVAMATEVVVTPIMLGGAFGTIEKDRCAGLQMLLAR